jgi:TetR/AcrR family transcriptional regulator, fatty acid metabolism regulator protein
VSAEQASSGSSRQQRTFIEEARRRQIVDSAIDVIAAHGLPNASLTRIAHQAGISKGVISYHFDGKDDLLYQIVADYGAAEEAAIWPNVGKPKSAGEALERYINAYVNFIYSRPKHLKATLEIIFSLRNADGTLIFDLSSEDIAEHDHGSLEALLRRGQQREEFGEFDPRVMAVTLRGAVDNLAILIFSKPDIDIDHFKSELNLIFRRATRKHDEGASP